MNDDERQAAGIIFRSASSIHLVSRKSSLLSFSWKMSDVDGYVAMICESFCLNLNFLSFSSRYSKYFSRFFEFVLERGRLGGGIGILLTV